MTRRLASDPSARSAAPAGMREQVMQVGLRRRRFAYAGAGSLAAVVVFASAALLGGTSAGSDSLRIDQPAAPSVAPDAPRSAGAVASGGQLPSRAGGVDAAPAPQAGLPAAGPAAAGAASPSPAANGGRGYHGPVTRTQHENKGICTGDSTMVGTGGFDSSAWCLYVAPPDPHDLITLTICRSAKPADGSPLTFETSKEVDFIVSAQGKTVWTWSYGRTFRESRHELTVGYNSCVDWTTRWDRRDEHGRRLAGQQVKLTAWTTAQELSGRKVSANFTA